MVMFKFRTLGRLEYWVDKDGMLWRDENKLKRSVYGSFEEWIEDLNPERLPHDLEDFAW